jgi:hypothetical protein
MSVRSSLLGLGLGAVLFGSFTYVLPSYAADLPISASWGEVVIETAGDGVAAKVVPATSATGGMTATLEITNFSANADGAEKESSAAFDGQILVSQSKSRELGVFRATVTGLIVKTEGATARADIRLGALTRTIEWVAADVKSERFTAELTGVFGDGKVPSPFPVSATLFVSKSEQGGAVLVSIDKITMDASPALTGSLSVMPTFRN